MIASDFPFSTNVIRIEQPQYDFFAASIPARILLQVAYSDAMSAELREDGHGYSVSETQRPLQSKRLNQIGSYIDREDSGFPNSIILAANSNQEGFIEEDAEDLDIGIATPENFGSSRWRIEFDGFGNGKLIIPSAKKLAAIIDGQHRLFGFTQTKIESRLDMNLLCSIFIDLPKPYQAQIFATINSTQKPVDKSLTYELFGYNIEEEASEFWSPDKLAVFFCRKLSVEADSPLCGKVLISPKKDFQLQVLTSSETWKVSTAVIVEGILRLISSNPKKDGQAMLTPTRSDRSALINGRRDGSPLRNFYLENNDQLIFKLVWNFLTACSESLWKTASIDSFITKTVGIQALFDVLRLYLAPTAISEKNISVEFFVNALKPAAGIDFSSQAYRNASGSGRTIIRKALESSIKT
jgi:DNA phosphorothioation-associated DGQHR protein 1